MRMYRSPSATTYLIPCQDYKKILALLPPSWIIVDKMILSQILVNDNSFRKLLWLHISEGYNYHVLLLWLSDSFWGSMLLVALMLLGAFVSHGALMLLGLPCCCELSCSWGHPSC